MISTLPTRWLRGTGRRRAVPVEDPQTAVAAMAAALMDRDDMRRQINQLAAQLADQQQQIAAILAGQRRADWLNANAVSVPAGWRDITPGDEPTHPMDVRTLRAATGGGIGAVSRVVPVHLGDETTLTIRRPVA